jgi:hypothetical protein
MKQLGVRWGGKARRVRGVAALLVLAFLATACNFNVMQPGETLEKSCEGGGDMTYIVADHHQAFGMCNGEIQEQFYCPDGLTLPTQIDADTIEVECAPVALDPPAEEGFDDTGDPEAAAPPELSLTESEPMSMQMQSASGYCSGGQGWVGSGSYTDRRGRAPDSASDPLNVRTGFTVTWCVISGTVQCGLSFIQYVQEGRWHEINERADGHGYVLEITPCGIASRTMYVDWDFEYGWCPWCVKIDWDLTMTVDRYGHYWGSWRQNGNGY